jgi:hypothetical protein
VKRRRGCRYAAQITPGLLRARTTMATTTHRGYAGCARGCTGDARASRGHADHTQATPRAHMWATPNASARSRRGHTHNHAGAGVQGRARLETLPCLGARACYRAGWPPRRLAATLARTRAGWPRRGWSRGGWLGLTAGRRAGCVPRRRELAGSDRDAGAGKIEGGRPCVREVEREKREMWAQK